MAIQIVRVAEALPSDFDRLVVEAAGEGVRNVALIAHGWTNGSGRFDGEGEALFAAFRDGELAGIGGLTPCPHVAGAARVRRFYVSPAHRRAGIGRALAAAAMQEGLGQSAILTCNARATALASPFWEAMGFVPTDIAGITHTYPGPPEA